ncbi:K(+)/H(+) antiporter [Xylographa bjoerkii]|nr:K(+)/H(+) antiporter [Xylographa bjoerkii]
MGHVPGFTNAIFPAASIPNLSLVANVGLVPFLFLVGLEVDLRFLVSNWRVAITVGALGMALPFGMGCAIAYGLYNQFRDDPGTVPISFGVYMLFIAVAMAITAFPVLCRILTELKLLLLTDRASSVMKVAEIDEYTLRDPVVNTLRTFGQLRNLPVSGQVMVVPEASYATILVDQALDVSADMMLIPWTLSGTMSEYEIEDSTNRFANGSFSHFVLSSLLQAPCNTAIFVDNGFSNKKKAKVPKALSRTISAISARDMQHFSTAMVNKAYHIYLPYIGSEDDKAAIRLVLQLARDPSVTATLVQFELPEATMVDSQNAQDREQLSNPLTSHSTKNTVDTTAYSVSYDRYSSFFSSLRDSLPTTLASRVVFETVLSSSPYQTIMRKIKDDVEHSPKDSGDLIVLGRNSALDTILSASSGGGSFSALLESDAKQGLGVLAEGILGQIPKASLLVIKASG